MSKPYNCEVARKKAQNLNKILGACLLLTVATIVVMSYALHRELNMTGGGARVPENEATGMVRNYRGSTIDNVFGGTTSYLMSIDSLLLLTKYDTSIKHIHAFFGIHNDAVTLVFTGAKAVAPGGTTFINVPFKDIHGAPFDVEHVFPCIGTQCRVINSDGTPSNAIWTVPEFPDNR